MESYLRYRGTQFVNRFDANSYLYITKAMDYFDLANGQRARRRARAAAAFLVISFSSDWLYPSYQSQEIAQAPRSRNVDAAYCELPLQLRARRVSGRHRRAVRDPARLPGQHVQGEVLSMAAPTETHQRAFVQEVLGRSDYAIIGAIVARRQGAGPRLRRRRVLGCLPPARAWKRAASRSRAPKRNAPSPAASPSTSDIDQEI